MSRKLLLLVLLLAATVGVGHGQTNFFWTNTVSGANWNTSGFWTNDLGGTTQPVSDASFTAINFFKPARVTVLHNGILIQDHVELKGEATEGVLMLQDRSNPVRYRNIWIRKLSP